MSHERPLPPEQAWPRAKRLADMKAIVERASKENWLSKLKPGFLAGTFGLLKSETLEELQKHNELMGGGK